MSKFNHYLMTLVNDFYKEVTEKYSLSLYWSMFFFNI